MTHRHRLTKVLGVAIGAAATLSASISAQPTSPEQVKARPHVSALEVSHHHAIEGTWRLEVTPYICGTDTDLPPFAALTTYAQGGTLTGIGNSAHFLPGQRTSEFGVWRHTGGRAFHSTREAFILFPSPPPGLVRGTQRIEENIVVRKDRFRSEALSQLIDESGNIVMSGCARITGERMR